MRTHMLTPAMVCALLLATTTPMIQSSAEEIRILPGDVSLSGPNARQRLLVFHIRNNEFAGELAEVRFSTSDPGVVTIEDGVAIPRGAGRATIAAEVEGGRTTVSVEVSDFESTTAWSFRHHVLPVLSKAGCNSGGCHGALAGKGGFRLSLRGYAPESDHYNITRQSRGRRIELADPGRSLFLAKPTTALRHKGGQRLKPESPDYRVIAEWISQGAPPPRPDEPTLTRIEALPALSTLKPGDSQHLLVRAFYSDGRSRDVTSWAMFSSVDETVARVDASGKVSIIGPGEGAISAWFSSKIVIARVTAPYDNALSPDIFTQADRRNFIDNLILRQLRRLNLKPSPACQDAEFLRRAYLDTIGMLPSPEVTQAFLSDPAPDKRDRLIDRLLAMPEFVDYWTYKWSDMLLINSHKLRPEALKSYYLWVRKNVKTNLPWDEFARLIVTSKGDSFENGASNFYAVHQDPETMAENVSQAFLGLSIGCAKCHNHPLEKWTNDQYYAFANMFARVRAKGWGSEPRSGDGRRTLFVESRGDLIQPRLGKAQAPAPLDGEPLPFDTTEDRRVYLANWLTSPDNPYFSRTIANRIWGNFLGVGLVRPVDDLRVSNPASNEELLSALASYLVERQYNIKALIRVILQSETYQRSSLPLPENQPESRFYSRYYPRRLMAEVLHDAIAQVTDVPSRFDSIAFPGGDRQKTSFYPEGTRAIQLYDSAVASKFLTTFGRNERAITCECERSNEPSMVQVLHIANGATINQNLRAPNSRAARLTDSALSPEEGIERAYLLSLSRFPTAAEKERFLAFFPGEGMSEREAVEDMLWALMSSREFMFNH